MRSSRREKTNVPSIDMLLFRVPMTLSSLLLSASISSTNRIRTLLLRHGTRIDTDQLSFEQLSKFAVFATSTVPNVPPCSKRVLAFLLIHLKGELILPLYTLHLALHKILDYIDIDFSTHAFSLYM